MPYSGLSDFIRHLEKSEEIIRIKTFVDPFLEMTEISDRVVKNSGKALLFENNGTSFPVLMNTFGSDKRMAAALGKDDLNEVQGEIMKSSGKIPGIQGNLFDKLKSLPYLLKISGKLPVKIRRKGLCQQIIHRKPDLSIFPVLKCWPHDGGRFITLPMVHTRHPVTGATNVGMYRMQILDKETTAMHWQRHKTGANHFGAWKVKGGKMPVTVTLGGDPVYTWSATAPLPENIDEYILAGFIRGKKVRLVKCLTNDLWVPYDADIVIEGYVDPAEDMVWEGPFGDHTGFYSLADWYPKFHVTCITHSERAVYPATIVGIPPHEDAWLAKATEKIFLVPLKLAVQPEIEDFHMPDAGVAHNLIIVKIKKSYPGQGKKVISSLFGAGQMMFTKYLVVVSGEINLKDYTALVMHINKNTDLRRDLLFSSGPLDVLDHSSETFSMGSKLGVDATEKLKEEILVREEEESLRSAGLVNRITELPGSLKAQFSRINLLAGMPVMIIGIDQSEDSSAVINAVTRLKEDDLRGLVRLILSVDHTVDQDDLFTVAWQILGNSDPGRDIKFISDDILFIDGTIKAYREGGFPRRWPNIVCSSKEIIERIDQKWESLGIGAMFTSPSSRFSQLSRPGTDEVLV